MNVKLAAHIFSNSAAKSISYLGNKNKINNHNWKEVRTYMLITIL